MTRRRLLLGIVLLVVALTAGYLVVGMGIYDKLSVAHPDCDGQVPAGQTPASFSVGKLDAHSYLMPDYEPEAIPSRDPEISLSAWWIPSDAGTTAPAVVIVHGLNSCKRAGELLLAAGMLHRHGYSVLLFDLRNHGESTIQNGRYAGGTKEYRDVLGAWDWLINVKGLRPAHVGLMGFSLGAATALIASGEESRVAAMWEDSGYADLGAALRAELARNGYPTWFEYAAYVAARVETGDDLTTLSPARAVVKLHGRPLFITQGTADSRLSVHYATDLANEYRAAGGRVDPWIVPGSEHVAAIVDHPAEYEHRLVAFFDRSIGPP
jgi:dipeptidyl aminopeptidase/acylaminoacyl peptidase